MINTQALLIKMLYLFSIMFIGFFAAKLKYMNDEVNKNISRLVAFVTAPLQVLASVLKPHNHPIKNKDALMLTGIAFAMYIVLILVAKIFPIILRPNKKQKGCYQYLFIFSNIGYMGYPIIDALFGEEYRFYGSIFVLAFDCFCWTYGVALVSGEKLKFDKNMFLKPMVIASFLAYILYFSNFSDVAPNYVGETVYGTLYDVVSSIGNITSVLAMLIIGCSLAHLSFKQVFLRWQIYVLAAAKMIIFPILFWLVIRNFITDQLILGVIMVIVSMPAATNATIISYQFGGDENLASSGVFLTTLLSVITIPSLMTFFFK